MELSNFKKILMEAKIVELEVFKIVIAIVLIIPFTWGVSQAENILFDGNIESASSNFSIIGVVSEIRYNNILIEEATGSDSETKNTYVLDISNVEKIETSNYVPLVLSDIKVGDTIIGQGLTNGGEYFLTRIVSFSVTESAGVPVEVVVATSTDEVASSTDAAEEASTSTDESENASTTETIVETVVDTVQDIIENIIDAVTPGDDTSTPEESEEASAPESEPEAESEPAPEQEEAAPEPEPEQSQEPIE